jgi:hypothetical protein
MAQTVEQSQHFPSDKTLLERDYSGVIRKKRGSKWPIAMSTLFNPVPSYCFPASGNPGVTTQLTISGSNFTPGCKVYIDNKLASGFSFINEHTIQATAPEHSPSFQEDFNVEVKVVREDNRSGSNNNIFRYELQSSVSEVNPSGGFTTGGDFISVTGNTFKPLSSVIFSSSAGEFSNLATWKSSQLVETISPVVPESGLYSVIVTSPLGVPSIQTGTFLYEYRPPTLLSFIDEFNQPITTGSTENSKQITIVGQYFRSGAIVAQQEPPYSNTPTWGGSSWTFPADWIELTTSFNNDSTRITFASYLPPASASESGSRKINVFHDDGKSGSIPLYFYYRVGEPSITSFSPIYANAGDTIAVTGTHFLLPVPVSTIRVVDVATSGAISAATSSATDTNFLLTVPAITLGNSYKIYVSGAAGSALSTGSFIARAIPLISTVTPSTGGIAGFEIDVGGTGFSQANTVFTVDSQPVVDYTVTSAITALVTVPSHSVGTAYLTATNYADPAFSSTKAFAYVTASSIDSGSNSIPTNG